MRVRNLGANLAGQLVYPVVGLLMVPFYVERLGLDAFGLIGLMALVVSLLGVFSRGLGGALQRELSQRLVSAPGSTSRLVRSMEVCYWIAGAMIGGTIAIVAVAGGTSWIAAPPISGRELTLCALALSVRVGFGFPHGVYLATLMGAERQVLANTLTAALAVSSALASVIGVVLLDTVAAVFVSEAVSAAVFLGVFRYAAIRVLPEGPHRFDAADVRALVGISVGLMWTSGIGLLLSMLDRMFVGALLPIASLGVYTIAVLGGRVVTLICNPILQAGYPEMCRLASVGTPDEQASNVLRNLALLLLVAAAFVFPLVSFSAEVLSLWTADPHLVRLGAPVLSAYGTGCLIIALASVFYQWQTAAGRVRVAVRFNAAALVWFPLLLAGLIDAFGMSGAALAWVVYALLAWATNILTTFGRGALPRRYLGTTLKLTGLALAPALVIVLLARIAADQMFADSIHLRTALAAIAGVGGGMAALPAVRHHLPSRLDLITSAET